MEVDDIIKAVATASQTLRRESLRLANVTREAGRTIGNGAEGISDIEGKVTREGASERGQRTSFNGAGGTGDIEGKAAMGSGE